MTRSAALDISACLRWNSRYAEHREQRFIAAVRPDCDILPGSLQALLEHLDPGQAADLSIAPEAGWLRRDRDLLRHVPRDRFRDVTVKGRRVEARVGRFYPRALLAEMPHIRGGDRNAFRCTTCDARGLGVDLNHPLAGHALELELKVHGHAAAPQSDIAPCRDILALVADDGPGMQAPLDETATDFYADQPYARGDERNDALFYAPARLVPHLDRTALEQLSRHYGTLLRPGMAVLDLMASWDSHLPHGLGDVEVCGLGMNASELAHNPRLARSAVQDLNRDPRLPFGDRSFDAALCSLSVEYLVRPDEIWREVARVLKPRAPFAVSFSERWFPPKAVRIWTELHAYERIGLVLDYFLRSGCFDRLASLSVRGLPRPPDDKYARLTPWSDPLYLVTGRNLPQPSNPG